MGGEHVNDTLRINAETFVDVMSVIYAHAHAQHHSGLHTDNTVTEEQFSALCAELLRHEPLDPSELKLEYSDLTRAPRSDRTSGEEATHARTHADSIRRVTAGAVYAWYAERSLMDNSVAMATVEFRRCLVREQQHAACPPRKATEDSTVPVPTASGSDGHERVKTVSGQSRTSIKPSRKSLQHPPSDSSDVASRDTGRDGSKYVSTVVCLQNCHSVKNFRPGCMEVLKNKGFNLCYEITLNLKISISSTLHGTCTCMCDRFKCV